MGYLLFDQQEDGKGFVKAFSNRRQVSEFTEISYDTLTDHFMRKKQVWHNYEDKGILIVHFHGIEKGRQRVSRGPGIHNRNI